MHKLLSLVCKAIEDFTHSSVEIKSHKVIYLCLLRERERAGIFMAGCKCQLRAIFLLAFMASLRSMISDYSLVDVPHYAREFDFMQ